MALAFVGNNPSRLNDRSHPRPHLVEATNLSDRTAHYRLRLLSHHRLEQAPLDTLRANQPVSASFYLSYSLARPLAPTRPHFTAFSFALRPRSSPAGSSSACRKTCEALRDRRTLLLR